VRFVVVTGKVEGIDLNPLAAAACDHAGSARPASRLRRESLEVTPGDG